MPTDKTLYDGFASLKEGMDGATPLDDSLMFRRTARSINATHRGGYASQRPGWRRMTFDYQGEDDTLFLTSMFQGAWAYYPDSGMPHIIASIGGRLYRVELGPYLVTDVSIPGDYDSSNNPNVYFWQCEKWLIKQNGVDLPVIWDGVASRRPAADEIKTGTSGVYAWGRNWYARPDGFTYRATDLVRENGNREDVLKETANQFLVTSGDFAVPASAGRIRGLFVPSALDNGLGQGPVHVGTENAVFSCNAPVDRNVWQDLTDPIQTVSLNVNGPTGDRTTVVHNGDVFYRAKDGVRSYILARREFGSWGNVPISREVGVFIDSDNSDLLVNGSAVVWQNRLMMTCTPRWQNGLGVTHAGLVVLDFDLISTLKERIPPAWDGLWTGLDIHQVLVVTVKGTDRCFLFARSQAGNLELWEMSPKWKDDNMGTAIQWMIVGRQLDFGKRDTLKKLSGGKIYINDLVGTTQFEVSYMPDDYPFPNSWASWSECANTETCGDDGCLDVENRPPQYRTALDLPTPEDACNSVTGQQMRSGYVFQPVVAVEGAATIKRLRLEAKEVPETPEPMCGDNACQTMAGCGIDPYSHRADA